MILKRISFSRQNNKLEFVSERFQYFYHYWNLICSPYQKVLLDTHKYESHLSYLQKTLYSINNRFYSRSHNKYQKFFLDNEYFNNLNIVFLSTKNKTLITQTKRLDYEQDRVKIIRNLKKIIDQLKSKNNYSKNLINGLKITLSKDEELTNEIEKQIQILTNCTISKLYISGYTFDYIKLIPQIITFNHNRYKYPFKKTIVDFNFDKIKFEKYKIKFNRTLSLFIDGIGNLLSDKVFKGQICFKVFNLDFNPIHPIELQGVKFYNPNKFKLATQNRQPDIWEIENFLAKENDNVDSHLFKSESTCNAMCDITLRYPISGLEHRMEVLQAYQKCQSALYFLMDTYNIKNFQKIELNPQYSFLINSKDEIASFSLGIFSNQHFNKLKIDEETEVFKLNNIKKYNRLNSTIPLHKKLLHLIHLTNEYRINTNSFSFKNYWTAWEMLGNVTEIKELVSICYNNYDKLNYLSTIIILLNNYLHIPWYGQQENEVSLSPDELKQYGIEIKHLKKLNIKKFSKNYRKLFERVNFRFINLLVDPLETFIHRKKEHQIKRKAWINSVFLELKNERNIETHQNNHNEITKLKLREDLLNLGEIFTTTILNNMTIQNQSDLIKIKQRILTKTASV